jgi:hypothetical protein
LAFGVEMDVGAMASIFDGTDALIFDALRLKAGQHLKQKSACSSLTAPSESSDAIERLAASLSNRIRTNWSGRVPSRENWRLRRQTSIAARNTSPEVILERAVAVLATTNALDGWYNQIPVASGLIDDRSDRLTTATWFKSHRSL